MPVQSLYLANIGPFDEIEFVFDPHVNMFIGPNNSGKSSVLWALGDITVFPFSFPEKLLRQTQEARFRARLAGDTDEMLEGQLPIWSYEEHWPRERWEEFVAFLEMIGYSKFIPALRWSTDFRSPGPKTAQQKDTEDNPELSRRMALVSEDASLVSDETVIQAIIELHYRSFVKEQPVFRDIVDRIGQMATAITAGFPIEFVGVDEDDNGFYPQFQTIDGPVPLNSLSQGTQSIIQWLAHLLIGYATYYDYPEDLAERPGILIIDEIDAHLHPSWQRRIIPTLTSHFPNLQIFCSTHSPLMVAGLRTGQVQRLQRDENGRVTVSCNEVDITGWTADEILRYWLGVSDPTDEKAAEDLERLQFLQLQKDLSSAEARELEQLRRTISQDLVQGPMSTQLAHFVDVLRQVHADAPANPADT